MHKAFFRFWLCCTVLIVCFALPVCADTLAQPGDFISSSLQTEEAGYYHLLIQYSKASHEDCTLSLFVNDLFARKVNFATGEDETLALPVYFRKGENAVRLKMEASDGMLEIHGFSFEVRDTQTKMVIVPHQDDETFAFGASIMNMVEAGDDVRVVFATNGDGWDFVDHTQRFWAEDFGPQRLLESADALEILGLSREDMVVLGYPDGSLKALFNASDRNEELSFRNGRPYTYGNYAANLYDYHTLQHGQAAKLTGNHIRQDFLDVIRVNMPSEIYVMSRYDTHSDHEYCYHYMAEAIRTIQETETYAPIVHESIVHGELSESVWPERLIYDEYGDLVPEAFTNPSPEVVSNEMWTEATRVELTDEMIETKYLAIDSYYTQNEILNGADYHFSYTKSDEFFWSTQF